MTWNIFDCNNDDNDDNGDVDCNNDDNGDVDCNNDDNQGDPATEASLHMQLQTSQRWTISQVFCLLNASFS